MPPWALAALCVQSAAAWALSFTAVVKTIRAVPSLRDDRSPEPARWPRVSLVVPARDEARDLERAVRALQDGPFPYEPTDAQTVRIQLGDRPPELLNKALVVDDIRVRELIVERPTLEVVFLERTGHGDIR